MRGLGHDIVDVEAFAAQLAESGTRMKNLFSARELRQAAMRGRVKGDGEVMHLAARWAGKEAVIKAWCEAISRSAASHNEAAPQSGDAASNPASNPTSYPYSLDTMPWNRIEIIDDSHGCPHVALAPDVARHLTSSTAASPSDFHISLSHDGGIASAIVVLE